MYSLAFTKNRLCAGRGEVIQLQSFVLLNEQVNQNRKMNIYNNKTFANMTKNSHCEGTKLLLMESGHIYRGLCLEVCGVCEK